MRYSQMLADTQKLADSQGKYEILYCIFSKLTVIQLNLQCPLLAFRLSLIQHQACEAPFFLFDIHNHLVIPYLIFGWHKFWNVDLNILDVFFWFKIDSFANQRANFQSQFNLAPNLHQTHISVTLQSTSNQAHKSISNFKFYD